MHGSVWSESRSVPFYLGCVWLESQSKGSDSIPVQRMEPFHYMFGKQNMITLFFVWLKSRVERMNPVLCLVEEPYKCGVE
jgi:hypothetical protein